MRWILLALSLGSGSLGCGSSGEDSGSDGTDDSTPVDTAAEAIEHGREIVYSVCNVCHNQQNRLQDRIRGMTDEEIAYTIKNGYNDRMPPQNLDDDQIADVIAYLRDVYGNP